MAASTSHAATSAPLRFSAREGAVLNEFYRQGPVAAHLVLSSGRNPRLVIAFPAGNSGAALWFQSVGALQWQPDVSIDAAHLKLPDGGALHGVTAEIVATSGPITIRQAITSSVRVIRDFQYTGEVRP